MCDTWPCCPIDGINVRRWNIDGSIAWQQKLSLSPKAICGIDGSRTIVVGDKTSGTESEMTCIAADGSVEWSSDIGAQITNTLSFEQLSDTTTAGWVSHAVSICMRSTYELVVGLNFHFKTNSSHVFNHSIFAIVDNTTGTVTAVTAQSTRELVPHTMEIAQSLVYYNPDTVFARCTGLNIVPVDGTSLLASPYTDATWLAAPAPPYGTFRGVTVIHTDSDSVLWTDGISPAGVFNGYNIIGGMGGAVAATAYSRFPSASGYWGYAGDFISPQRTRYGANQLVLACASGTTSTQVTTVTQINASTLAVEGYLSLAANGAKYKATNACVVENVSYYNSMYVACGYSFGQLALINSAGAWQWRHRAGIGAWHVAPDGDLCTIAHITASALAGEQYYLSPTQPATGTSN